MSDERERDADQQPSKIIAGWKVKSIGWATFLAVEPVYFTIAEARQYVSLLIATLALAGKEKA